MQSKEFENVALYGSKMPRLNSAAFSFISAWDMSAECWRNSAQAPHVGVFHAQVKGYLFAAVLVDSLFKCAVGGRADGRLVAHFSVEALHQFAV